MVPGDAGFSAMVEECPWCPSPALELKVHLHRGMVWAVGALAHLYLLVMYKSPHASEARLHLLSSEGDGVQAPPLWSSVRGCGVGTGANGYEILCPRTETYSETVSCSCCNSGCS